MSDLIEGLLAESELHDDLVLRELLGELEREATAVRPIPSAALSELMSPRAAGAGGASSRRTARRSSFAGRGAVITGVVVIGVLGLGAGAAAASPEARSAIGAGVSAIAHLFNLESSANAPTSTDGSTLSPVIGGSHDRSGGAASHGQSEADHASSHQRDGLEHSGDPNSGSGSSGSGSSGSESSSSGSSGSGSSEHSGDSNSGDSNGDGSGKDGGDGNQSGHGGDSGKGNGGPAPTK